MRSLAPLLLAAVLSAQETGSRACAGCHAEIFRKYSSTGMAQSSGRAGQGTKRESMERAEFQAAGVRYRVSAHERGLQMDFARLEGEPRSMRVMEWFVGSGNVGRSYLFRAGDMLMQAPVSYFTRSESWGVSPGFERAPRMSLTRVVETACLRCHASGLRTVSGASDRFEPAPFAEGGISCERCHGPGGEHVARKGKGGIVNPAKLDAGRRESVCAQCHLTGAARVARARRTGYTPGALFAESTAVFVWSDAEASIANATSHFERLYRSACRKAAGERMWCGSCHAAHSEPPPAERAAFYRSRCQSCHDRKPCTEQEAARVGAADNCVTCHMPKSDARLGEHDVYTDHSIPRRPGPRATRSAGAGSLVPFWGGEADARDLGLAYAVVSAANADLQGKAVELLEAKIGRDPSDIAAAAQLGQLYDLEGKEERAAELLERVVKADRSNVAARVNLGSYRAKAGRLEEAMRLWREALALRPMETSARLNLAVAQFQSGDRAAAESSLKTALEYDPDQLGARRMLAEMQRLR